METQGAVAIINPHCRLRMWLGLAVIRVQRSQASAHAIPS